MLQLAYGEVTARGESISASPKAQKGWGNARTPWWLVFTGVMIQLDLKRETSSLRRSASRKEKEEEIESQQSTEAANSCEEVRSKFLEPITLAYRSGLGQAYIHFGGSGACVVRPRSLLLILSRGVGTSVILSSP